MTRPDSGGGGAIALRFWIRPDSRTLFISEKAGFGTIDALSSIPWRLGTLRTAFKIDSLKRGINVGKPTLSFRNQLFLLRDSNGNHTGSKTTEDDLDDDY